MRYRESGNYYADILTALIDAEVRFIVAGGVAAVLHGVERVTMDIDIALDMEDSNLLAFLSVMEDMCLKPRAPVHPEFILNPQNRTKIVSEKNAVVFSFIDPNNPLKHVDVFLLDELSYPKLKESCVTADLRGKEIQIVSLEKLIDLKKKISPQRPKDLYDIEELQKLWAEDE